MDRKQPIILVRMSFAAIVAAMFMQAGCYRHVVGVEGVGSGNTTIYEPNLKESGDTESTSNKTVPTKTVPSKRAP